MNHLQLTGLRWRSATLDLTITRASASALRLDGQTVASIPPDLTGPHSVEVETPDGASNPLTPRY